MRIGGLSRLDRRPAIGAFGPSHPTHIQSVAPGNFAVPGLRIRQLLEMHLGRGDVAGSCEGIVPKDGSYPNA
jgi:hypothetical protein